MIGIVDYGVGNLFSLKSSLAMLGQEAVVTGDKEVLAKCDRVILPGVGAFEDAIAKLKENGIKIDDDIYTVKYAKEKILQMLAEKDGA